MKNQFTLIKNDIFGLIFTINTVEVPFLAREREQPYRERELERDLMNVP